MRILTDIENLCAFARKNFRLSEEDLIFSRNLLCHALKVEPAYGVAAEPDAPDSAGKLLEPLVDYAVGQGIAAREDAMLFDTYLVSLLLPRPSAVIQKFQADSENLGVKKALENFYKFNIASNYIRMEDINKNIIWEYADEKGSVIVTINKSKPEKDNKEIARLKSLPPSSYPKCMLCLENLGYAGRQNHPARENLRVIPLELNGEKWYLQYSPYVYYNEHCIVFSEEHRPMVMNRDTFSRLAEFVEKFPCYFLGSNACLPIVGGSILTHEHFQGGGFIMPMHRAAARETFAAKGTLRVQIADWYNSVIRLTSPDREEIVAAADEINEKWKVYSNPALGILAETDQPHNAVTPIFRKAEDNFVAELILRNNRTDETYPDGIFHAHPEYHGIKKEGIGIIEVMGLFILPGRLDAESAQLAECLTKKSPRLPAALEKHHNLFDELKEQAPFEDVYAANKAIRGVINRTCVHILENTAVFKADDEGQNAFRDFVRSLSFVEGKSI